MIRTTHRRRDALTARRHISRHGDGSRSVVPGRSRGIRRRHRRLHARLSVRIITNRLHANLAAVGRLQRSESRPLYASVVACLRHGSRISDQTERRARRHAFRHAAGKTFPKQQHSRARNLNATHSTQSPIGPSPLPTTGVAPTLSDTARIV